MWWCKKINWKRWVHWRIGLWARREEVNKRKKMESSERRVDEENWGRRGKERGEVKRRVHGQLADEGWGERVGKEWEGWFLILLFFLLMMSPVEPGLPHACLSPQTQHATLFPMQLSTMSTCAISPPPLHTKGNTHRETWHALKNMGAHKQTSSRTCNTSSFSKSTHL